MKEKDIIKQLSSIKEVGQFDIEFTTNLGIEHSKQSENVVSTKYNEIIRPDNVVINFTYHAGDK